MDCAFSTRSVALASCRRAYPEGAAKLTGLVILLGVLGTFGPGFLLGLQGMRTRVVSYPESWGMTNQLVTMSALLLVLGLTLPILYFFYAVFWGEKSDNPWDATTLEWSASSPPPHGNFATPPRVHRGPYEYSVPGAETDFVMQADPGGPQAEPAKV